MFYDASRRSSEQWITLSPEDKKKQLFLNQKQTLDLFLERRAISEVQYKKSLNDLIEKMEMQKICESNK